MYQLVFKVEYGPSRLDAVPVMGIGAVDWIPKHEDQIYIGEEVFDASRGLRSGQIDR